MLCIKVINAFLTPLIAIIALYIAYQQYIINKKNSDRQYFLNLRKLNLDLYQKRFLIFNKTKQILLKINQDAKIEIIEIRDFKVSTNEGKFLFDDDIINFLQELRKKSIELTELSKELENTNIFQVNSPERENKVKEKSELVRWFTFEYEHIEERFMKYLDFKKL